MKELSYGKSILFLIVGAAAIAFGGDLTVDTASRIAIELGMSQTLVGLTIVSIGTSTPSISTFCPAARAFIALCTIVKIYPANTLWRICKGKNIGSYYIADRKFIILYQRSSHTYGCFWQRGSHSHNRKTNDDGRNL